MEAAQKRAARPPHHHQGPGGAARNLPVRRRHNTAAACVQSPQQTLIFVMRPSIFTPHLLPANSSPADLTAHAAAEAPAAAWCQRETGTAGLKHVAAGQEVAATKQKHDEAATPWLVLLRVLRGRKKIYRRISFFYPFFFSVAFSKLHLLENNLIAHYF